LPDIAALNPQHKAAPFRGLPARARHLSGGLEARATLVAMAAPAPFLSHVDLLLALLRRWFGLWASGKPSARFVRVMERTEAELADAIRAALREDGVNFPALDDPAFLKWFAKNCPGSEQRPRQVLSARLPPGAWRLSPDHAGADACAPTGCMPQTRWRLAMKAPAGWKPTVQQSRAPP
jgi:hypothetical protein